PNALDALQHDESLRHDAETPQQAGAPTAPEPASASSAASAGNIYMQFGAFSAAQTADNLAQKLNAQIRGIETRPVHVQASSNLYRVQIGPYPSRTAAVNAALRIQQETGQPSSVALR